jgi:hypothetical protein
MPASGKRGPLVAANCIGQRNGSSGPKLLAQSGGFTPLEKQSFPIQV